ncbi:MAG: hypothetical protein Q8888_02525 [Vigna little leaf phytoplasma]|nr:hypothetical protein [Vigna little leaf phytoplasma]
MMNLIRKIIILPYRIISIFVTNLINSSKVVTDWKIIKKKISKHLEKKKMLENPKIVTYQSVYVKFLFLILIFLISFFFVLVYFSNEQNCQKFLNIVISVMEKLKLQKYSARIKARSYKYSYKELHQLITCFLFCLSIIIFITTSLLWLISMYLIPSFLKITNYLSSFSNGFMLGSFYILFTDTKTPIPIDAKNKALILFFYIPFTVTILVLGLITYLHQIKKIKENTKYFLINLFCLLLFINIIIHIILSLYSLLNIWFSIISLIFSILEFIFATLLWKRTLDTIDQYIYEKLPKKYEFLLVSFLFFSFIGVFYSAAQIILNLFKSQNNE